MTLESNDTLFNPKYPVDSNILLNWIISDGASLENLLNQIQSKDFFNIVPTNIDHFNPALLLQLLKKFGFKKYYDTTLNEWKIERSVANHIYIPRCLSLIAQCEQVRIILNPDPLIY